MTEGSAPSVEEDNKVAVVLSGAGARGAFQAGALAELMPTLEREGITPTIWLGTSAGSLNVVLWGSAAHLGAQAAADAVLGVWRQISDDDVYRPLLSPSQARNGLQYGLGALLGRGPGTTSVLDTAPLHRTAANELRTGQLATNVASGLLDAVGVVATRMPSEFESDVDGAASGRSVLFLDEHVHGDYSGDPDRALDVARGPLNSSHVLASLAVPVAFPPVPVTEPGEAQGWYIDGSLRLNTPLHPAVGLGAGKIVLVSATSTTYSSPPPPDPVNRTPDIADAAAQVLHAALADRTTEDLIALRRTNRLVAQASQIGRPGLLENSTGRPYRQVELMRVSPRSGVMGQLAAHVFDHKTGGLGRLTETDNWLLGKLIRGAGDAAGRRELLSYLFFDEDYSTAAIALGRATARAALSRGWER